MRRICSFIVPVAAALAGCVYQPPEPFTAPVVLGGETVSAETLNKGQDAYTFYCSACHGAKGDGRGASSVGLTTPPRDFRLATFKFAAVQAGDLPHDQDLVHIVNTGLEGTAMLRWSIPDSTVQNIVHYIKTFSPADEGWRDPDGELGERIVAEKDPWVGGKEAAGVERGAAIFHGIANCYSCHPAYESRKAISDHQVAAGRGAVYQFRPGLWKAIAKPSETYSRPVVGDPKCTDDDECPNEETQVCRFGVCEEKVSIIPPDFLVDQIRSGTDVASLFRVVANGIPGTAMPMWKGGLPDDDIWAIAYFVQSLAKKRGSTDAMAIKKMMRADTAPMTPPAPEPEPEEAAPEAPATP